MLYQPTIYCAGKVKYAPLFREMRDKLGYNITARWIDLDSKTAEDKALVWELCHRDACDAEMLVLYCGAFNDYHLGSIVEAGHMMGREKPVYQIGTAMHLEMTELSDAAFTYHTRLWHKVKATDIKEGYAEAVEHYRKGLQDWFKNTTVPQ